MEEMIKKLLLSGKCEYPASGGDEAPFLRSRNYFPVKRRKPWTLVQSALFPLFLVVFSLLLAPPVYAKDFSSFYKVTYEFNQSGEATVTQEISLVNLSPDLYASEYSLSLISGKITNVEAYDKIGPLKTTVDQKGETTIIKLEFNDKVVGKGKILSFILKYKALSLAKKEGNLWQISIPKLANPENIDEFSLSLKVPVEYGKLSVANPTPLENKTADGFYYFSFSKEQVADFGILATFGQYQTFDFKILYQLENSQNVPVLEKIAIPPDTNYQNIYYDSISPLPLDVQADKDQNWLAIYQLSPGEKLQVEVRGQVNIFSQPQKKITASSPKNYLGSSEYWQTNDPKIVSLAKSLKTAANIYKYVSSNLSYDYQGIKSGDVQRTGALAALANPTKSTCSQFTDLFIALCRAAGIPSREVVGFAQTDNPQLNEISQKIDLLHTWPEYFDSDKNTWIAVDPTFGNTTGGLDYFNKFDMNHFAFVIHGESDSLPYPPGSSVNDKSKKIFVSFAEERPKTQTPNFSLEQISPPLIYSLKQNKVVLQLRNNFGGALYQEKIINLNSDSSPKDWSFERILPYSLFKIELTIKPEEKMKDYLKSLAFSYNEIESKKNEIHYNIEVQSLLLRLVFVSVIIFSLIISGLIIAVKRSKKINSQKAKQYSASQN